MEEITSFSESTISMVEVGPALLRFVLLVGHVVLFEFVGAVGKLAFGLVGAVAKFHELSA